MTTTMTAPTTTTLVNTFHGTEYVTRKTADELAAIEARMWAGTADAADKALERKIRKALCGIDDCKCSGYFGIRD